VSKNPIDPTHVAWKALTGIDSGWYDAHWYRPQADTAWSQLGRVIRRSTTVMGAVLARAGRWPVTYSRTKISRRLANSEDRPPTSFRAAYRVGHRRRGHETQVSSR
jgi:hypothetical protein